MNKREVLAWLERHGTRRNVEGLARYGIVAPRAFVKRATWRAQECARGWRAGQG